MSRHPDEYDVVIVGAGATGSWAAMDLTARGARVAVLDAGAPVDPDRDFVVQTHSYLHRDAGRGRSDASAAEDGAAPGARQPIQSQHAMWNVYNAQHWVDDLSNPYVSTGEQPMQWFQGGLVGGRSNLWGGGCLRLSDHELQAWPIEHADLAPYYDRVERTLAVAGTREGLAQLPDGPFLEAGPLTAAERRFKDAIENRWPDRRVTRGRGPVRRAWSAGEPPPFTGPGYGLEVARRTGRMTLLARAAAHQVLTRDGAAVGVGYVDRESKERREVLGGAVLLCASTIQTARLLLNSAPGGLANSSGMVGRNLMDHTLTSMVGVIPGLPTETYRELGEHLPLGRSLLIPRFRNLGEPSPGFEGGYGIWAMVGWDSAPDRWPEGDGHSPMPRAFEGAVLCLANALGEVLPRAENGVEIDPHRQDADGIPIVRIHLDYGPNEARMRADALASLREMLGCVGGVPVGEHLLGPGSSIHEVGTARMGVDPRSSVVNPDNETWDVRNLFVSDGACWPTSGWQNVTLSLLAITARCCDAIAERLRSSPPRRLSAA